MTVRKFLDISTGHLPPSERERVEGGDFDCCPRPAFDHRDAYAWMFYVPDEPEDWESRSHACWLDIFKLARELGCDYVLIDRDASGVAGLAYYGDEEVVS